MNCTTKTKKVGHWSKSCKNGASIAPVGHSVLGEHDSCRIGPPLHMRNGDKNRPAQLKYNDDHIIKKNRVAMKSSTDFVIHFSFRISRLCVQGHFKAFDTIEASFMSMVDNSIQMHLLLGEREVRLLASSEISKPPPNIEQKQNL
ncbi:hypothetical protein AMTRI_Chr08g209470 [Amborella trichopoda]